MKYFSGHYNEKGYKKVGNKLFNYIKKLRNKFYSSRIFFNLINFLRIYLKSEL